MDDARQLARSRLADPLPRRWHHVQAVAATAEQLAAVLDCDRRLLVSAAWLHDLGYATTVARSGFHPLDGARFLREAGWPEEVCGLVAYHTCARVEAGQRGLGAQLAAEFIDVPGAERDALWTADATTGPDGQRFTLDERVSEVVERYGPRHLVSRCMLTITPHLAGAVARTATRTRRATRREV